jgi:hypothetical protein
MNFFNELKKRLALPSPEFFKRIAKFGKWAMAVGGILVLPLVPSELGVDINLPVKLPAIFSTIGGYLVVGGYLVKKMADLTVEDSSKL